MTNEIKKHVTKTTENILELMAKQYNLDSKTFLRTLKNTVIKSDKNGKEATEEQVIAFLLVANKYKLNPFIKEIYAYPDKGGGIVPVVSTDGWNKIMTTHPDYKNHTYSQSDNILTMKGAKPCPESMTVHIFRKDGSETTVTEYLDECFRELNYSNPWLTHTKRMLRHKTKIQGGREAFGLGGIYDDDEVQRIIETEGVIIPQLNMKPDVSMPQGKKPEKDDPLPTGKTEAPQLIDLQPQKAEILCQQCDAIVTKKVEEYSKDKFGLVLCFTCQSARNQ